MLEFGKWLYMAPPLPLAAPKGSTYPLLPQVGFPPTERSSIHESLRGRVRSNKKKGLLKRRESTPHFDGREVHLTYQKCSADLH